MVTIHVFHSSAFEVLGLLFRGELFAFTMPGRLFCRGSKDYSKRKQICKCFGKRRSRDGENAPVAP